MDVDDSNILAWGPSYRLLRTRLVLRYADCLAWLERAGLTTDSDPEQTPSPQVRAHTDSRSILGLDCDARYRRGPTYRTDFS
jgi:hypothetical protein